VSPDLSETGEVEPLRSTPFALVIIDVGVALGAHKGCGGFILNGLLIVIPAKAGTQGSPSAAP
jgi:hypothetical protein